MNNKIKMKKNRNNKNLLINNKAMIINNNKKIMKRKNKISLKLSGKLGILFYSLMQ